VAATVARNAFWRLLILRHLHSQVAKSVSHPR